MDPDYVVHIEHWLSSPRTRETVCERFVNLGYAFWHSSQLRPVDDMVTCVMCVGARRT